MKGKYGNGYEMGNEWTGRRLWVDFGDMQGVGNEQRVMGMNGFGHA